MYRYCRHAPTVFPDHIYGKNAGPQKICSYDKIFWWWSANCWPKQCLKNVDYAKEKSIFQMKLQVGQFSMKKTFYMEYYNCLDAPATKMSTIYYMLERPLRIMINWSCLPLLACMIRQYIQKSSRSNVKNPINSMMSCKWW